jgi:hypothetical protein
MLVTAVCLTNIFVFLQSQNILHNTQNLVPTIQPIPHDENVPVPQSPE